MIAVAVAAHACAVRGRPLKWALAVLAAGLCVTAQLLTVEAGAYAIAAAVGMTLLAAAFSGRGSPAALQERRGGELEVLGVLLGTWAVLQALVAAALSATARPPAGLLDYHRGALRIATGYALTMSSPWDLPAGITPGIATATVLVLGMAAWRGYGSDGLDRRLLWGWALLALAQMKGALTRSDLGHVFLGFTPIVVLCVLLLGDVQRRVPSRPWWLAFVALLFAWPAQGLIWRELVVIATGRVSLRARWQEARRFRIAEERLLPIELLRGLPRAREPLLVIPYQNHLAAAMDRPLVGGIHQAYSAYTLPLQHELVEAARRAGPGLGVVVVEDGPESPTLDGVDTISRLPYVFEYLLEAFAPRRPDLVDHGAFALERRSSPRVLPRRPLEFRLGQARGEGVAVLLAAPARCPLVELRLSIRYPWWLWLGRTAPLVARFSIEGGPLTNRRLVPLVPRGEFITLASLVPADEVPRLFSDDPPAGEWWESLEIVPGPSDRLGIAPSALEVTELSCLLR